MANPREFIGDVDSNQVPDRLKPIFNDIHPPANYFDTPFKTTWCAPLTQLELQNIAERRRSFFDPDEHHIYPITEQTRSVLLEAFQGWKMVASVNFIENNQDCQILVYQGNLDNNIAGVYSSTLSKLIINKDFFTKQSIPWQLSVLSHEVGHALSFRHGFGDRSQKWRFTAPYNSSIASIMNYDNFKFQNFKVEQTTPAPIDIELAQKLFGPNKETQGNDVVKLADMGIRAKNVVSGVTLLDMGGNDILDARGCGIIDLQGNVDSLTACYKEKSIVVFNLARGTVFENIVADGNVNIKLGSGDEYVDLRNVSKGIVESVLSRSGHDVISMPQHTNIAFYYQYHSKTQPSCTFSTFTARNIPFGQEKRSLSQGLTVSCAPDESVSFPGLTEADVNKIFKLQKIEQPKSNRIVAVRIGKEEPGLLVKGCYSFVGSTAFVFITTTMENRILATKWSLTKKLVISRSLELILTALFMQDLSAGLLNCIIQQSLELLNFSQQNKKLISYGVSYGLMAMPCDRFVREITNGPVGFSGFLMGSFTTIALGVFTQPLRMLKAYGPAIVTNVVAGAFGACFGRCLGKRFTLWGQSKPKEEPYQEDKQEQAPSSKSNQKRARRGKKA